MKYVFLLSPLWFLMRQSRMEDKSIALILTALGVLCGVLGVLFDFSGIWNGVFS